MKNLSEVVLSSPILLPQPSQKAVILTNFLFLREYSFIVVYNSYKPIVFPLSRTKL